MNYKQAINAAYLHQQGLNYTEENVQTYGVKEEQLALLYETEQCWVILDTEDDGRQLLNVVRKNGDPPLETTEL